MEIFVKVCLRNLHVEKSEFFRRRSLLLWIKFPEAKLLKLFQGLKILQSLKNLQWKGIEICMKGTGFLTLRLKGEARKNSGSLLRD